MCVSGHAATVILSRLPVSGEQERARDPVSAWLCETVCETVWYVCVRLCVRGSDGSDRSGYSHAHPHSLSLLSLALLLPLYSLSLSVSSSWAHYTQVAVPARYCARHAASVSGSGRPLYLSSHVMCLVTPAPVSCSVCAFSLSSHSGLEPDQEAIDSGDMQHRREYNKGRDWKAQNKKTHWVQ